MNDYQIKDFKNLQYECKKTYYSEYDKTVYCLENSKECLKENCPLLEKVELIEDDLK